MHVSITGVPRRLETTGVKVDKLVVPFVQALRSAYIDAKISDDESATVDMLTDVLVYAAKVEGASLSELAENAVRAAQGELVDAATE